MMMPPGIAAGDLGLIQRALERAQRIRPEPNLETVYTDIATRRLVKVYAPEETPGQITARAFHNTRRFAPSEYEPPEPTFPCRAPDLL